jgi:hypothetical protein
MPNRNNITKRITIPNAFEHEPPPRFCTVSEGTGVVAIGGGIDWG